MMNKETHTLKYESREIRFDIRYEQSKRPKPLLIFLHGFKGFRNWAFIPLICEEVAKSGGIAINVDFSMNGIVEDNMPFYDESIFFLNTLSSMRDDIEQLLASIGGGELSDLLREANFNGELILAGHSMGAALAMLFCVHPAVTKLILMSPVATFDRHTDRHKKLWKDKGFVEIKALSSNQVLKLSSDFIEDKEKNFPREIVIDSAHNCNKPILIIHGSEDLTVKVSEAMQIYNACPNCCDFEIIENAGHTFGSAHPLKKHPTAISRALTKIKAFIH